MWGNASSAGDSDLPSWVPPTWCSASSPHRNAPTMKALNLLEEYLEYCGL